MQPPEDMAPDRLTIGQVVEQLSAEFPDITHSSLRFLEREGLITPDRTIGGHRLFPADQVNRIRTIKLWQRQRLSLDEIRERLKRADTLPAPGRIAADLLDRLVAGDRDGAQRIAVQTADVGLPLAAIYDRILLAVLAESDARLDRGDFTAGLAREVFEAVHDLVILLGARQRTGEARPRAAILAAGLAGEAREPRLRMLAALLRERGLRVYLLGTDASPSTIAERARARAPEALLLVNTRADQLPALRRSLEALRAGDHTSTPPHIFVAGRGLDDADVLPLDPRLTIIADRDLQATADYIAMTIARQMRDRGRN